MSLELTYVVVTDTFETIRRVTRALAAQSVCDRVELVIACPSERELRLDAAEAVGLGAVRIIEVDSVIPLSPPRAAAVRAASCPLVFIGETHSFPAPDCLEALLAAHRSGDYAAVMPVVENANPETALSWACLMLTYRHWIEPATRGEIGELSTYNACYRRDLLLAFGDRLAPMLDYGSGLDTDLRAGGGTFSDRPGGAPHAPERGFAQRLPAGTLPVGEILGRSAGASLATCSTAAPHPRSALDSAADRRESSSVETVGPPPSADAEGHAGCCPRVCCGYGRGRADGLPRRRGGRR